MTNARIAGLGLGLSLFASTVAAQRIPSNAEWSLRGLRSGLCVEFLVSPEVAAEALDQKFAPAPVERLAGRFPVLAREAAADPAFAGWIPSEYCWFAFDSAMVKGRRVVEDRGRNAVVVGYVAFGATIPQDSTALAASHIFSNSGPLVSVAVDARAKVDDLEYSYGLIPDLEDSPTERRHEMRRGKLVLQWDGHPGGTRPVESQDVRLFAESLGFGTFDIKVSLTPDSAFVASGSLRVQGRGPLLDALAASPIRFVTPYLMGGDMEWGFQR